MGDTYRYSNGREIEFLQGYHGADPQIPMELVECLYDPQRLYSIEDIVNDSKSCPTDLPPKEQMCEELASRWPEASCDNSCAARCTSSSTGINTTDLPLIVEFINYGHSHLYPASVFKDLAPLWRQHLISEETLLEGSISDHKAIYKQITGLAAAFAAPLASLRRPSADKFDDLLQQLDAVYKQRLRDPSEITYPDLHAAGVEFEKIRHSLDELLGKVNRYRVALDEGADTTIRALKTTESAAWFVNKQAALLLAKMNGDTPWQRCGYQMAAVLGPKLLGHGLGEYLAAVQGRNGWAIDGKEARAIFRELSKVFCEDGGDILAGLAYDLIEHNSFNVSGFDNSQKKLVETMVKEIVMLVFEIADLAVWEREKFENEELLREIITKHVKVFALGFISSFIQIGGGEKRKEASELVENITDAVVGDFLECQQTAQKNHEALTPLIIRQLPFTMAKLIVITVVGPKLLKKAKLGTELKHRQMTSPAKTAKPATAPEVKSVMKGKRASASRQAKKQIRDGFRAMQERRNTSMRATAR